MMDLTAIAAAYESGNNASQSKRIAEGERLAQNQKKKKKEKET